MTGEEAASPDDDRAKLPAPPVAGAPVKDGPSALIVEGADPKPKSGFPVKAAPLLLGAFLLIGLAAAGVILARRQMRQEDRVPAAAAAPAETRIELPATPSAPPHAAEAPDPRKILNNADDALKAGAATIEEESPSIHGTISELPPPPLPGPEGSNAALQDAAKDAARLLVPDTDDPSTIDLSAPPGEALDDPPGRGASADFVTPPVAAAIDNARLAEEVAGLKAAVKADVAGLTSALAAERRRGEEQAAEIARLNGELDRLRSDGAPGARAALALDALKERARAGGAYRAELDAYVATAAVAAPAILAAHADAGLPTPQGLKARFPELRNAALARIRRGAAKGPVDGLGASLAALVDLRPAHPQSGPGPVAAISRAEAKLEAGDLAGALGEIETLSGAAAAAFAPFIADARARLAAEAALAAADRALLAALGKDRVLQ